MGWGIKSMLGLGCDHDEAAVASNQVQGGAPSAPSTSAPSASTSCKPGPTGQKACTSDQLLEGGRYHVKVQNRYLTLVRLNGQAFCIDSVCFHAGGPLGIGDIEEVNGRNCIICPWHFYKIDIETGDKYYQTVSMENGKMVQGDWKSNGYKQRVFPVTEVDGNIYVDLSTQGRVDSDEYACNAACGDRVLNAPLTKQKSSVGSDGLKPRGAPQLHPNMKAIQKSSLSVWALGGGGGRVSASGIKGGHQPAAHPQASAAPAEAPTPTPASTASPTSSLLK